MKLTTDSTVCGDSIKDYVSLVPWFPFKLDSSRDLSMAGGLEGQRKDNSNIIGLRK